MNPIECRSCKSMQTSFVGRAARGRWFAGASLEPPLFGGALFRCANCDLLQRSPILPQGKYEALYKSAGERWAQSQLRPDQLQVRDYICKSYLQAAKVLDIGCSSGDLLHSLGPRYQKFGIEPSLVAAAKARCLDISIIATSVAELKNENLKFDVITAVDIIEHIPNPFEFLLDLSKHLSPGGEIIVSTGNSRARAWVLIGPSYYYSHNFEHISFISPAWCKYVAANGLSSEVINMRFRHEDRLKSNNVRRPKKVLRTVIEQCASLFERAVLMRFPGSGKRLGPWFSVGEPGIFKDHFLVAFRRSNIMEASICQS